MAKKIVRLVMLVMVPVFGMTVFGCDNGPNGNDDAAGVFTLTGIPSGYNGMYALLEGGNDAVEIIGVESYNFSTNAYTATLISNGSVRIPLWDITNGEILVKYSGSHTVGLYVCISKSAVVTGPDYEAEIAFYAVAFSNGSAVKSWNEGQLE